RVHTVTNIADANVKVSGDLPRDCQSENVCEGKTRRFARLGSEIAHCFAPRPHLTRRYAGESARLLLGKLNCFLRHACLSQATGKTARCNALAVNSSRH